MSCVEWGRWPSGSPRCSGPAARALCFLWEPLEGISQLSVTGSWQADFLVLCTMWPALSGGRFPFLGGHFRGVCVAAGMTAFAFLSLGLRLTHYDNFSHWALAVKYLLLAEELPGAETTLLPFRDYPPGSSLFVAYICRYMGHSQGQMLLAQNSLLLACFLAVFGVVRERRRFLLYSFLGMGLSLLSYLNLTVRINNLLVDFLLPLLALSSMAYSRREENNLRLCAGQILLLGFTGIVKDTGLFLPGRRGSMPSGD